MLQKEKKQINGYNYYLLGKSNKGHGLVYLRETDDEYELIYKDEEGHINEINTFGGYRLYEPREMYDMLSEFVISDNQLDTLMNKMYNYHAALGARNISTYSSIYQNDEHYKHYVNILNKIRKEIAKMLEPESTVEELDELKKELIDLQKTLLKAYIKRTTNNVIHEFLKNLLDNHTDGNDLNRITDLVDSIGDKKLYKLDIGTKVPEDFDREFAYHYNINHKKASYCKLVFTVNDDIIKHIAYYAE